MHTVTILTPTCNRPLAVLERCIASVNRQTLLDWTHVVCSDGQREPAVAGLVDREGDERRRYFSVAPPRGHFGAGVRAALLDQVETRFVNRRASTMLATCRDLAMSRRHRRA